MSQKMGQRERRSLLGTIAQNEEESVLAIVSNYHISQHHANGNLYHNKRENAERCAHVTITTALYQEGTGSG